MAVLIKYQNVSVFRDKPYGFTELSMEIERGRRYLVQTENEEQLNTFASLVEKRLNRDTGRIEDEKKVFVQSDRLLMGEKIYAQTVREWLSLRNEFFHFGNRRRSKFGFIESLKARHLADFPIYKLRDDSRIKFVLLAMAFQESGVLLFSDLINRKLKPDFSEFLIRILNGSHAACCLVTCPEKPLTIDQVELPELIKVTVTNNLT